MLADTALHFATSPVDLLPPDGWREPFSGGCGLLDFRRTLIFLLSEKQRCVILQLFRRRPGGRPAGMVELADTMDLGSIGKPCRFKSCYPHQLAASVISLAVSFFISLQSLSCARSAASRFQTEPTSLGFGLGLLLCGDFILLTRQYRLQSALPSKGASFWDVPFDGFRCPEG